MFLTHIFEQVQSRNLQTKHTIHWKLIHSCKGGHMNTRTQNTDSMGSSAETVNQRAQTTVCFRFSLKIIKNRNSTNLLQVTQIDFCCEYTSVFIIVIFHCIKFKFSCDRAQIIYYTVFRWLIALTCNEHKKKNQYSERNKIQMICITRTQPFNNYN